MLGRDIVNSREYKEYEDSLGTPFERKLFRSIYSGGEVNMKKLFISLSAVELIEESQLIYLNIDLISKANREVRYGKV